MVLHVRGKSDIHICEAVEEKELEEGGVNWVCAAVGACPSVGGLVRGLEGADISGSGEQGGG